MVIIAIDFLFSFLLLFTCHLGWRNSEASSVKRIIANALRISIVAVKSLSLLSYFTFVASSDNAPTLMLRMIGYRMAATNSSEATNYRPSQLFLEQRKFMWLAMIVCGITNCLCRNDYNINLMFS